MTEIHATAIVNSSRIGARVSIAAHCVVEAGVALHDDVRLHAGVVLLGMVEIGAGTEVFPYAVIGKPPARSAALSRSPHGAGPVQIGPRASIGAHAVIYSDVTIGADCLVGDAANIRENCRVGDRCVIGRATAFHPDCTVGDESKILDQTHLATGTVMGRNCFVSVHVAMVSDPALGKLPYSADRVRGPRIGDRVAIGAAAILLPGVQLGNDAVVAAGAVVTRDVEAKARVFGLPARAVGERG